MVVFLIDFIDPFDQFLIDLDHFIFDLRILADGDDLIDRTNRVLSDAAFARYAPAMGITPADLYRQTEQLINDLEDCKL